MDKNVGGYDRIARLVFGPLLLLVGVAGYAGFIGVAFGPVPQALGSIVIALLGVILLGTGLAQRCIVNRLLNVDTFRSGR